MNPKLPLEHKASIREVWLEPRPGLDMTEAVKRVREAGNPILHVDHDRRRILVARRQD